MTESEIDQELYLSAADLAASADWSPGEPLPPGVDPRIAATVRANLDDFAERVADAREAVFGSRT